MKDMKKIIQYYSLYYKASGGIETHISELARNMNCNIEILTDAFPGMPPISNISNNIKIVRIRPMNYNNIAK